MTPAWIETSSALDGLVEDKQIGTQGEGARDADALALPAGELVRVPVDVRGIQADLAEEGADAVRAVVGPLAVHAQRVGDDGADRQPRIQRGIGVLVDDLEPSSQSSHCARRQADQAGAIELDLAPCGRHQAEHEPRRRGLAAARLADEGERLAPRDIEAHVGDGAHPTHRPPEDPGPHGEVLDETADLEERRRCRVGRRAPWRAHPAPARRLAGVTSPRASTRWHVLTCPGPTTTSGGSTVAHGAGTSRNGQRGWKAQPSGRCTSEGG